MDAALHHARRQGPRFVDELKAFVALPSVSAQPRERVAVRRCADWLAAHLRGIGLHDATVLSTPGQPIVWASARRAATAPTLLVYGHYDVQPAEPLAAWRTPPFEPDVRGDYLYGRGSSDDKGQMFAFVKAIECCLQAHGSLPVNVVCVFEGEEEVGSPNLLNFVKAQRRQLACDVAVMADACMASDTRPAIVHGMRGALYLELDVFGPRHDLHSGNFGGAIHNPLQALCELVAALHDRRGRIAVPGFYDRVRLCSDAERAALSRDAPAAEVILRDAGASRAWGETGYSVYERLALRPALTVNGLSGGYSGPGTKGVIPAQASAKLSFRLVPDQDPAEIDQLLRRHLCTLTPPSVQLRLRTLSAARPALVDLRHPAMAAAAWACREAFGAPPAWLRGGGTIPALHAFASVLGAPSVLLGFAPTDAGLHAPDERLHLPTFHKAVAAVIWLLAALGRTLAPRRGTLHAAPA